MAIFETPIFWGVLALAAVVCNGAAIVMKLRVNERMSPGAKFSWWNRDAWRVAKKYSEFFPDSYLPLAGRLSFWLFVTMLATFALSSLIKQ